MLRASCYVSVLPPRSQRLRGGGWEEGRKGGGRGEAEEAGRGGWGGGTTAAAGFTAKGIRLLLRLGRAGELGFPSPGDFL